MTQPTLDVGEAAALLHMNVKRVQSLARSGRLPAMRVGRRWLFQRDQLEQMLGAPSRPHASVGMSLSARNALRGTITRLSIEGLMAEVQLDVGGQTLVSIITRSSAERLQLAVGQTVCAIVKSTEVMIGKEGVE